MPDARLIDFRDTGPIGVGRPFRGGILGSSTMAAAHILSPGSNSFSKPQAGFAYWAEMATAGAVLFPYQLNFAMGGTVSADWLVGLDAQLATMAAAGASFVVFGSGSNNDAASDVPLATTVANYEAILDRLRFYGLVAVVITPTPRGVAGGNTFTGTKLAAHFGLRRFVLSLRARSGVIPLDIWPNTADILSTSGQILTTKTKDTGLHLNTSGARDLGLLIAAAVGKFFNNGSPRLPCSNADTYSADNPGGGRLPNPMFLGTGGNLGGMVGQLADNWSYNGAGLTPGNFNVAKVADGQKLWQQASWSAQTISDRFGISRGVDLSGLVDGESLYAIGAFELDAGHVNIGSVGLTIYNQAGRFRRCGLLTGTDIGALPSGAYSGLLVTDTFAYVGADTTALTCSLRVFPADPTLPCTATVRFGTTDVFKV